MQHLKWLESWLYNSMLNNCYLFTVSDLRVLFPDLSENAYRALMARAVRSKVLKRLCQGVYLYEKAYRSDGYLLFHVASVLRPNELNYVSLETVLSESGVISQVPVNYISVMSSGRSYIVSCGDYGTIEFIHTDQKPESLQDNLVYEPRYGMWKANIKLAIRDMKKIRRNTDLIDWSIVNEFI